LRGYLFKGNHGEMELLEIHCNQCGWAISGEGVLRDPGRESFGLEKRG